MKYRSILFILLLPFVYLLVALITNSHYGVSIDETAHFRRGQGYLHYFITGNKNYNDLPSSYRKSFYMDNFENGSFYLDAPSDQSHPPLNDTLAAATNYIFYQRLGIVGDVQAHHLFGIGSVFLLILFVSIFSYSLYGEIAAMISGLSILLYPIFLAESHFNVKDPVEASYFSITIILYWYGITRKNWRYIILSSLSCSVALGTKFNIFFAPVILLPWIWINKRILTKLNTSHFVSLLLYPIIVLLIFFLTNPNLWIDTIFRLQNMFHFYVASGTKAAGSLGYQPSFIILGFNSFPLQAILYQTPLVILFFSAIGIYRSIVNRAKDKYKTYVLLLAWLIVPIFRVSLPTSSIYGGIRHIFEFIPALAIFSGYGFSQVIEFINVFVYKKRNTFLVKHKVIFCIVVYFMVFISFAPIVNTLISIHPNENVYYNILIGGLKGAHNKAFPYSGDTLGNIYLQGASWLNSHAEKNSCVAIPLGHTGNLPPNALRPDIQFSNTCQSGTDRKGEYAMDMVYTGFYNNNYTYAYYPNYLNPVYEIKVDDVVIFQIFKNDIQHSKKELIQEELIRPSQIKITDNKIYIALQKMSIVSRLEINYATQRFCKPISDGYVELSIDGEHWIREPDPISVSVGKELFRPEKKYIERRFAAKKALYIKLNTNLDSACSISLTNVSLYINPNAHL